MTQEAEEPQPLVHGAPGLDAEVLAIARRVRRRIPAIGERRVRVDDYEHVLTDLASYRLLARETPNLIPVYSALHELQAAQPQAQPVQRLKAAVLEAGFTRATWRLVANAGPRLLGPVLRFFGGQSMQEAALAYLRMLESLELRAEPPRWLIEDLLSFHGNEDYPLGPLFWNHGRLDRLEAHVVGSVLRLGDQALARRHEVGRVLAWMTHAGATMDVPRQRAGWPWLVRTADRWHEARRRSVDGGAWPVPFERLQTDGVAVRALASAVALWEEGERMRHCAGDFARCAASGKALVLSLTAGPRRDRHATALLEQADDGDWQVAQVAGFANRRAAGWAKAAAARVAQRLGRSGRSKAQVDEERFVQALFEDVPAAASTVARGLEEADEPEPLVPVPTVPSILDVVGLQANFWQSGAMLHLDLTVETPQGEHSVAIRVSSLFCTMRWYVSWLEALALGNGQARWEWDGEGPWGSLAWEDGC